MFFEIFIVRMLLYFVSGILLSALGTWHVRVISEKKAFWSAVSAFISTLVGIAVVVGVVSQLQNDGLYGAIVHALGIAIGSYIVVTYKSGEPSDNR